MDTINRFSIKNPSTVENILKYTTKYNFTNSKKAENSKGKQKSEEHEWKEDYSTTSEADIKADRGEIPKKDNKS